MRVCVTSSSQLYIAIDMLASLHIVREAQPLACIDMLIWAIGYETGKDPVLDTLCGSSAWGIAHVLLRGDASCWLFLLNLGYAGRFGF